MLNKKVEGGKKTNERGESNGIRNPGQDLFTLFLQSKFKCTPYPRDTSFPSFLPLLANFLTKVSGKTPSKDGNALVLRSGINRWFPAKVGYNCFRLLQATLVALWNEKFSLPLFREIIASPIL